MTAAVDHVPSSRRGRASWLSRLGLLRFPLVAFLIWRPAWGLLAWLVTGHPTDMMTAWDGEWYLRILRDGYAFVPDAAQPTAFFPLLPWVTEPVLVVVRNELVAVLIVTNLAALAAICAVFVALREWRGERIARTALVLFLVWPTSYILWSYYSEALFIAASALALWAFRRNLHAVVVIAAALATMARVPGVLLVVLLVGMRIWQERRVDRVAVAYGSAGLAFVPILLAQHVQAGDAFAFLHAGKPWGRRAALPWVVPVDAYRKVTGDHGIPARIEAVFDMLSLGLGIAASVWLLVRARRRPKDWPREAGLWALAMVCFPLFTGSHLSMSRYVLSGWPVFGAGGELLSAWSPPARGLVYALCGTGCVLAVAAIATGWFVA